MEIDLSTIPVIPTLIDQYREVFEGEITPGWCWIVDGKDPKAALFATLDDLSADQAFAPPVPGARPIAAHVAHLRFSLDLTRRRLLGENPPADWAASFDVPGEPSRQTWDAMKADLRRAYAGVLEFLQQHRDLPPEKWVAIRLIGTVATIAHDAYHLAAIRQIVQVVRARASSATGNAGAGLM